MTQYEKEQVERIIKEIQEMESEKEMTEEKKAYYLYHELGKIYQYKDYYLHAYTTNEKDKMAKKEKIDNKIKVYEEGTTEIGEAICKDMNQTFIEGLRELGIESHLSFVSYLHPVSHSDVNFKTKSRNWYFANLTADIMHIQTGMKVRSFGVSQERLEQRLYHENPRKNKLSHLFRMNRQNGGKKFTEISEEQLKEWDHEFGFNYKGLYTNEVIDKLAKEATDEEFVKEFFGTDKKDEIVQKKLEFVMEKIGIINVHHQKKIGNVEAMEYYMKIANKILTAEEKQYLDRIQAFTQINGKGRSRNIIVLKKKRETIYYLYQEETQRFERIEAEQLKKDKILYYNKKEGTINSIEDKLEER